MARETERHGGGRSASRVLTVETAEQPEGSAGDTSSSAPQSALENNSQDMEVDTPETSPEKAVKANGARDGAFGTVNHVDAKTRRISTSPLEAEAEPEEANGATEQTDVAADGLHDKVENDEVPPTEDTKEGGVNNNSETEPVEEAKEGNEEMETNEEGEIEVDSAAATTSKEEETTTSEKPKLDLPYSTRGRQNLRDSSEFEVSSRGGYRDNNSEADAKDVASDLGFTRPHDIGKESGPGASFLDSLSEEERRLRTRYLPEVDGVRALHKSEIKSDVLLARSIMSSAGVAGTLKKSRGRKPAQGRSSDEDRMDVDDEEGNAQSEDERTSDVSSRHGSSSNIDVESRDFSVCSGAFVAPPEGVVNSSNGDLSDSGTSSVPASKRWQMSTKTPIVVESLTAFNPPRPPESVGPKKKNRMLRWERRPHDVEHDLRATRKTVQKTREELHRAERERERIETFGAVMRTHFLKHLDSLKQEGIQLNEELASIQVDCVKAADLLTSRTRSRGVGKSVYVMRDVISVLKTRGASLSDKGALPSKTCNGKLVSGVGGLSSVSFVDWDSSTSISPNTLANAWTLPGDKVQTPYGDGVVLHVFGPSALNVNDPPVEHARPPPVVPVKEDVNQKSQEPAPETNREKSPTPNNVAGASNSHGFGGSPEAMVVSSSPVKEQHETPGNGSSVLPGQVKSNANPAEQISGDIKTNDSETKNAMTRKTKKPKEPTNSPPGSASNQSGSLILPRVCVRLSFGIAFFPLDDVTSKEDPASYSDAMLAARWKKMTEVAKSDGSFIDVSGMEDAFSKQESTSADNDSDVDEVLKSSHLENMEVEEGTATHLPNGGDEVEKAMDKSENAMPVTAQSSESGENKAAGDRFVPLGAGMFPTVSGRGAMLADASIGVLENGVDSAFCDYSNDLGRSNNPGVPEGVKGWEAQRYETCLLQAKVLQLRNELYRQRRIRTLNERTFVNSRDRSNRVENLLAEMKSDLVSLKDRLEEELYDLGIDEDQAAELMTSYYKDKERAELSPLDATPPPKRKRKLPKEQPRMEPKHTRRRAADAVGDTNSFERGNDTREEDAAAYIKNDDDKRGGRVSGDEMGMDQSSDDDADRRVHKRSRIAA